MRHLKPQLISGINEPVPVENWTIEWIPESGQPETSGEFD